MSYRPKERESGRDRLDGERRESLLKSVAASNKGLRERQQARRIQESKAEGEGESGKGGQQSHDHT